jgi:hypothetical protein
MTEPPPALDRRLHAFRPDLADAALQGRVEAQRFTPGQPARLVRGAAALRRSPDPDQGIDTQLLYGERVTCFDVREGFAWVRNEQDGYVGYLDAEALGEPGPHPTHRVSALRTFLYPKPDMKMPVLDALSLTSPVNVEEVEGVYGRLDTGGWIFLEHLRPFEQGEPDIVATAQRFLGMPYRWGGKESVGLDCSALVQMALHDAGLPCPRDSDMQADRVGQPVAAGGDVERGDLLYFPGHVAIALSPTRVIHATAFTMAVCEEDLEAVIARALAESGRGLTAHRRLP